MARDSKAGIVLAIRDEELGVEGKYFPLGGFFAWEHQRESIGLAGIVERTFGDEIGGGGWASD